MSDAHGGHGGSNWKPLRDILLVIIGIWILWYFTGGPERAAQNGDNPYMEKPSSVVNGPSF